MLEIAGELILGLTQLLNEDDVAKARFQGSVSSWFPLCLAR